MNNYKLLSVVSVLVMAALMLSGCGKKMKVVREVSSNLYDEDILDLTGKNPTGKNYQL